ncbi:Ig-like domain-containing protein [Candidatus Roizmanbacteria bacterium]|nr:Ig-like domain-containing protein [Candidatus Roizmanbacteria bacterium]
MDKKLVGLMLIFMLSFGLFATITVFNKPLTRLTKAKEEFLPSSDSSLLFAWPLTAKADGEYSVQINVFVRNATNIPLSNKKVHLATTVGSIKTNNLDTDKAGKATFMISSTSPGLTELSAVVDNQVQLKQKISVKFE